MLNPGLMSRINEGTLPATVKVTYSHAQAEVQGLDKKRTREEGAATDAPSHPTAVAQPAEEARPAKTQRTDPASDEDEDDGRWLRRTDRSDGAGRLRRRLAACSTMHCIPATTQHNRQINNDYAFSSGIHSNGPPDGNCPKRD